MWYIFKYLQFLENWTASGCIYYSDVTFSLNINNTIWFGRHFQIFKCTCVINQGDQQVIFTLQSHSDKIRHWKNWTQDNCLISELYLNSSQILQPLFWPIKNNSKHWVISIENWEKPFKCSKTSSTVTAS